MARIDKAARYRQLMEDANAYVAKEKPCVCMPSEAVALLRPLVLDAEQEMFYVLLMNTKNRVIDIHHVSTGLVDRIQLHAREIFREAIVKNATSVIFAHNHPSNDPTPSSADISLTRQMVEAGKIIGIKVLDHVVIGKKTEINGKDYASFREENLLTE